MKIGIVTQPLIGNYGGILQNFALQRVLIEMGHEPITFDYIPRISPSQYILLSSKLMIHFFLGKSKKAFLRFSPKRYNFDFIKKYINISKPLLKKYSSNLIYNYNCDAIIVGSDQVWRPKYNIKQLYDQYLEFCSSEQVRRIAYAASFGSADWEYTEVQADRCSKLLRIFDAVSVREESGQKHLNRLGYYDSKLVLDPTILLGRNGFEQYLNLDDTSLKSENYLGAYILDEYKGMNDVLDKIRFHLNLTTIKSFGETNKGFGVIEWIKAIKFSSCFVTDSFHGTVFCILYHVPFVTLVNIERGADRFATLLTQIGLADRMVYGTSHIESVVKHTIDWQTVDEKVLSLRQSSIAFLASALS